MYMSINLENLFNAFLLLDIIVLDSHKVKFTSFSPSPPMLKKAVNCVNYQENILFKIRQTDF